MLCGDAFVIVPAGPFDSVVVHFIVISSVHSCRRTGISGRNTTVSFRAMAGSQRRSASRQTSLGSAAAGAAVASVAGASGAVFGMYGVFLALLTTNLIPKKVRQPLLQSIVVFVLYNLVYGLKGGIDNAAHIGGFIAGLLLIKFFSPKEETASLLVKQPFIQRYHRRK